MSDDVVTSVRTIEVGNSQYRNFIDNRTAENQGCSMIQSAETTYLYSNAVERNH